MALRHVGRLSPATTALFLCDMQEAFRKTIQYYPEIIQNTVKMVEASKLLNIPVVVTEQYPKGLGHTVDELKTLLPEDTKYHEKTLFSMCIPSIKEITSSVPSGESVTDVILTGIESHVCVLQTTIDLLEQNVNVHIAADCVSSRSLVDRKFALERFAQMGAFVSTSESLILQLCKDAKNPSFRSLQKLITNPTRDTALLTNKEDERLKNV
ncbi:isochorismatase domain-containing protein 2-like [Convolutriloba macropyga]|uniref:isochorismatase domain-containing protein 2-like n=1 Tax=Convolutriloba macropyga TaxID=536237 RepID=UPI003F525390